MGAEVIILFNPYTYNFLKGLTHSALKVELSAMMFVLRGDVGEEDSDRPINSNKQDRSCWQNSVAPPPKPEFSAVED